ncbi:MAG: glycosyltransferase [Desulfovibrionaceae bacterium]
MLLLWWLLISGQCLLLIIFWQGARTRILETKQPGQQCMPPLREGMRPDPTPNVAMVIPAAGQRPYMRRALRSLMVQDYPHMVTIMVTESLNDPAVDLIHELQKDFPHLRHVVAGPAEGCGQKNWNLLQAIKDIHDTADIYVFCDSTHYAQPDFVRQLILPILQQEAAFTTGYHAVDVQDHQVVSLGYQLSVLLMRFLQASSAFTQPWGGAMAISRQAFLRHDIAGFWSDKVVDDCSLASYLMEKKSASVQLCPHAVLRTPARNHPLHVWQAWMNRQVLFLKFCIPQQWMLLGVFALLLSLPLLGSAIVLTGIWCGLLSKWFYGPLITHVVLLVGILWGWRECLPRPVPMVPWFTAFVLSMYLFLRVYVGTIRAKGILWNNIDYRVAKGGKVLSITPRK